MSKCLVLFVEGETEVEFQKAVINFAREKRKDKKFDTKIECKNVCGIGGFKNIACRKFIREIKPKYDGYEFTIVLCSDTDVFELEQKPPVNWTDVKNNLISAGASNVVLVRAKKSIEDWFLYDLDNILSFLRLKKGTKISGRNGYDRIKRLYRLANKMQIKGMKSNGMVAKLDIAKISLAVKDQLSPLYKSLGVKL